MDESREVIDPGGSLMVTRPGQHAEKFADVVEGGPRGFVDDAQSVGSGRRVFRDGISGTVRLSNYHREGVADHVVHVSLVHIMRVEYLPQPATGGSGVP